MKSVRVLYTKKGRMKFVSHLDMTRLMTRLLRKSKLPVWYTEGFNKHVYITFALPLSLGFESDYEVLEFKLSDDTIDIAKIPDLLNQFAPEGIQFFDCFEAVLKLGAVAFADYRITFSDGGAIMQNFSDFLAQNEIMCNKKTKRGDIKTFDFKAKINSFSLYTENENTCLDIILPAGSNDNVNPELLFNAYFEQAAEYYGYTILRRAILDADLKNFK